MTLEKQVSSTLKSCFTHLKNIGYLDRYSNFDSRKTLINTMFTSRLNYANAIFQGLPFIQIKRLQRLQNLAARLVTDKKKHAYIYPILKSLHWLSVHCRIRFKNLLLTCKCLHGQAPSYLTDLVQV